MRSRRNGAPGMAGVLALVVLATGSACSGTGEPASGPTATMAVDAASDAIVDQLRAATDEAYLGRQPTAGTTLAGIDATAKARAALDEEVARTRQEAEAIGSGDTPLSVDAVSVQARGERRWKKLSGGRTSVTVDIEFSWHYVESDVDSGAVVPHEIVLDSETGKILDIVVMDQDYYDAQQAVRS